MTPIKATTVGVGVYTYKTLKLFVIRMSPVIDYFCPCAPRLLGRQQCDQIWRFIGLWPTFTCFLQHLIYPNLSHSQAIFVKMSKYFYSAIIFGQLLQTFGDFFSGHTGRQCHLLSKILAPIYFYLLDINRWSNLPKILTYLCKCLLFIREHFH